MRNPENHIRSLQNLQQRIIRCRKCPRLVKWREKVARAKTKRFSEWKYWGKPNPGFGDPRARVLVLGLAPAAHGGNRTGRVFTGDRSGDWLYRTLHKFDFSNTPISIHREDGLKLEDCYITATARCAPPANKLMSSEIKNCRPYLLRELELLKNVRAIVALGRTAFDAALSAFHELKRTELKKKPKFFHGAEYLLNERVTLVASYHPSQQNTFTGKLTEKMFDGIFARASEIVQGQ